MGVLNLTGVLEVSDDLQSLTGVPERIADDPSSLISVSGHTSDDLLPLTCVLEPGPINFTNGDLARASSFS